MRMRCGFSAGQNLFTIHPGITFRGWALWLRWYSLLCGGIFPLLTTPCLFGNFRYNLYKSNAKTGTNNWPAACQGEEITRLEISSRIEPVKTTRERKPEKPAAQYGERLRPVIGDKRWRPVVGTPIWVEPREHPLA